MNNNMTLRIDALPQNESFARSVVAAFCVGCNPTLDVLNDVRTAVSEAITNCIVHAYDQELRGDILVEANLCDNMLYLKICDYGRGIDNIEKATMDFYSTKPDEERSGLGFTIMRSFMDSLNVESKVGCGTTVSMTKLLA